MKSNFKADSGWFVTIPRPDTRLALASVLCPAKLELKLIQRLELAANIYSESSDYLHRDGGNEICFISTTSIWHLVRPGCPHCSDLCLSPSPTRSGAAALKQGVKRKIRVVTSALRSQPTLNHISLASEDNILISTYILQPLIFLHVFLATVSRLSCWHCRALLFFVLIKF